MMRKIQKMGFAVIVGCLLLQMEMPAYAEDVNYTSENEYGIIPEQMEASDSLVEEAEEENVPDETAKAGKADAQTEQNGVKDTTIQDLQNETEGVVDPSETVPSDEETETPSESVQGWYYDNGWYYYEDNTRKTGWLQWKGEWYYLDGENTEFPGLMLANCNKMVQGREYSFDSEGIMRTGWWFSGSDWYYFKPSGAMALDWEYINGQYYYLDSANGGAMVTEGWKYINEKWYHFAKSGAMHKEWILSQQRWFYLGKDGAMRTGWESVNGRWYYFFEENEIDESSWGRMASTYWKETDGKWYYLNSDGAMEKGWMATGNTWYYLGTDGAMRTDWQSINGYWYYFYKENDQYDGAWGRMARNIAIDGWYVKGDGINSPAVQAAYEVLNEYGWNLRAAFNWSAGLTYRKNTANPSPGSEWFANYGFKNGSGNCYVMAATFYYMADILGYDVHQVTGYVPLRNGGKNPHSWCEVVINGTTYVFDPDFTNETGRNGYQIRYGTSGTWRYVDYYRMN